MTAEDLKKSILQQAIQGKLVLQCPDDEPASVLLDRIRAEKARLVAEGKIKRDKNESIIYRNADGQYIERIGKTETDISNQIPFEIPDSWEWCRIGDIFTHNNGKQLNKSNKSGVMMDYITTSNLYWDGFRLDNLKQMPFEASEIERCQAVKGDLLVCEGGDIGRSCIWEYDYPIMLQNHIHRLRGVIDVKTKYFYYIFYLYNLIGIIGGKGIGIQGFSSKALHNTFIPLPPHTEQERIVAKIEELMPMVEEYGKVHSRLDELNSSLGDNLRKSVLQYAIQGKLVPQNPAEEPAYALLDRIRAEKNQLVAEGKIKRDKNESVIYRNDAGQYIERNGKTETDITDQIPFEIPDSWDWTKLENITYSVGNKNNQVQTKEILKKGAIPVVSQGQNLIDGYCEDIDKKIDNLPLVMFGDHTRNVKFIDFPFVIGADGTKFHKCILVYPKYIYYWMTIIADQLRDRGYARHYSLLKKEFIPLPPLT